MLIPAPRILRWLVIGLLWCPAWGQIAKEIPPGSTADAVIRAYGWPKGKASTADREVWTYEKFQVTLINGQVVSVSGLPPPSSVSPGARASTPRAITTPSTPSAPVRLPPSWATKKAPVPSSAKTAAEKPSYVLQPATPVVRTGAPALVDTALSPSDASLQHKPAVAETKGGPSAQEAAATPSGLFGWNSPWIWLMGLIAAALAALKRVARRKRQMRTMKPAGVPVTGEGATPRKEPGNWKEEIADRLARSRPSAAAAATTAVRPDAISPAARMKEAALRSGDLSRELLLALEWKRLEQVVMEYFKATGLRAECTSIGADGGIDVLLYQAGEANPFSYVQCKAYSPKNYVEAAEVRSLYGVMAAAKIAQGVFVTTSEFGRAARTFASENGIEAINGTEFLARFAALPPDARATIIARVTQGDFTTPTCATHDVKMVSRENGTNGSKFWACPQYRCKRTINVRSETMADR